MSTITARRPRKTLGVVGVVAGGALALSLSAPAFALAEPFEPAEEASTRSSATTFTPDLQTEIFIAEESMPNDFVSSADGTTGYVTSRQLNEFTIIDMAKREVSGRIATPGTGAEEIVLSPDGSRAYFAILAGWFSSGVGVLDLASGTLINEFTDVPEAIEEIVVSQDGASLYVLGNESDVARIDPNTGAKLATTDFGGVNAYGMVLINNDSKLLIGMGNTVYTLDAETLEELDRFTVDNINSLASFVTDGTDERVYFADSAGSALGAFNPATGELLGRGAVGSPMHEVVGSDANNRAFGNVIYWDKLMAADLNTGKRSESFRATPTAPYSMKLNPVTGELLSANAGFTNAEKGSTVTIVNPPSVANPANAEITAMGDDARFETDAVGIKRGNGGGIAWQSSEDGETWTDIEGAYDEQLDVVATAETMNLQYRVRWVDDFWGQRGASEPARIVAPAPMITFDGPLEDGTVGTAYPNTVITATGQDDLAWSLVEDADVTGLPAGMELDAATGALTGTPTEAGSFTFTVRVTDVFGEDTRSYDLTVNDVADPTDPVGPTPTDPTDPAGPTDPANPGDTSGGNKGGQLSDTGGASPLLLSLLAAGVLAAGGTAVMIARKRGGSSV